MCHAAGLIERYVLGKDSNRPHLLREVFTEDVELTMHVHTGGITFPPDAKGIAAATDVVCSRLNRSFENIYTFCFSPRPASTGDGFSCGWLVVMSEKDGGSVRAGGGSYAWSFSQDRSRVSALTITVSEMATLPPDTLGRVMAWAQQQSYPWCDRTTAEQAAATIPAFQTVLLALRTAYEQATDSR